MSATKRPDLPRVVKIDTSRPDELLWALGVAGVRAEKAEQALLRTWRSDTVDGVIECRVCLIRSYVSIHTPDQRHTPDCIIVGLLERTGGQ